MSERKKPSHEWIAEVAHNEWVNAGRKENDPRTLNYWLDAEETLTNFINRQDG